MQNEEIKTRRVITIKDKKNIITRSKIKKEEEKKQKMMTKKKVIRRFRSVKSSRYSLQTSVL